VKKIWYVEYYSKARDEGHTPYNIVAGWSAAGIAPWNPRKVIRSPQLAANNQINQQPPQTPRKRKLSASEKVLATPRNKHELLKAIQTISSQEALPRSVRNFLSKTSKVFDTLHHQHAQDSLQIEALKKRQDELVNKRKKKIATKSLQTLPQSRQLKRKQRGKERPGNSKTGKMDLKCDASQSYGSVSA